MPYTVTKCPMVRREEQDLDKKPETSDDVIQQSAVDVSEEKLNAALELASSKLSVVRLTGLDSLCQLLARCFMPIRCESVQQTLIDLIGRSLRRGEDKEQSLAAQLAKLLAMQLGDAEQLINSLQPHLLRLIRDEQAAPLLRANCCSTLATLRFFNHWDVDSVLRTMHEMTAILAGDDTKMPTSSSSFSSSSMGVLHCAAMAAWSMLLTRIPGEVFVLQLRTGSPEILSITLLLELMQSAQLEVRLSAGKTIALMLETGRETNDQFLDDSLSALVEQFQLLVCPKQRQSRQLKIHRIKFRQLLNYVEQDEMKITVVRFGEEQLALGSCRSHTLYAAMARTLGGGLNKHLMVNEHVRSLFRVKPTTKRAKKAPKSTRKASNKKGKKELFVYI